MCAKNTVIDPTQVAIPAANVNKKANTLLSIILLMTKNTILDKV